MFVNGNDDIYHVGLLKYEPKGGEWDFVYANQKLLLS